MNEKPPGNVFDRDAPLRGPLASLEDPVASPAGHDESILLAAGTTAEAIQRRTAARPRWQMPMSMAASFVGGIGATLLFVTTNVGTGPSDANSVSTGSSVQAVGRYSDLTVPLTATMRGAGDSNTLPVDAAPADVWYRYIQELIYSGDAQLAARHLERFVQLHPDFKFTP